MELLRNTLMVISMVRKKSVDESNKPMKKEIAMKTGKTWRREKIDNPGPVRHRSSKIPIGKDKNDRIWKW